MEKDYVKFYSRYLNREMEINIYGHGGKPCLVFPAQDGRFYDFAGFGMVDAAAPFIDQGKLQLFCIDSIDKESWSFSQGDCRLRIERHEQWFNYIIEEVVPFIHHYNQSGEKLMTTGCSMGASHAANFFFRRPDIFDTVIAMSGYYSSDLFFGDYMDDLVYLNSPVHYLEGMAYDHPNVQKYRENNIIICTGQGAWEDDMIRSTKRIEELLGYKDVGAWVDYWGYDVNHDWPWWRIQFPYFLGKVLGE